MGEHAKLARGQAKLTSNASKPVSNLATLITGLPQRTTLSGIQDTAAPWLRRGAQMWRQNVASCQRKEKNMPDDEMPDAGPDDTSSPETFPDCGEVLPVLFPDSPVGDSFSDGR